MTFQRFEFNKLVRDKLPELMNEQGVIVHKYIMDQPEFISKLKDKLIEESNEAVDAQSTQELVEELADVLEVIHSLADSIGTTFEQIEQKRTTKSEKKGKFKKRIFCSAIEIDSTNPALSNYMNYYQNHPRYPRTK